MDRLLKKLVELTDKEENPILAPKPRQAPVNLKDTEPAVEDEEDITPPTPTPQAAAENQPLKKDYLGKSGDTHLYIESYSSTGDQVQGYRVIDPEGHVVLDSKEMQGDISSPADFVLKALDKLDVEYITQDMFKKHIRPIILSKEEKEFYQEEPEPQEDFLADSESMPDSTGGPFPESPDNKGEFEPDKPDKPEEDEEGDEDEEDEEDEEGDEDDIFMEPEEKPFESKHISTGPRLDEISIPPSHHPVIITKRLKQFKKLLVKEFDIAIDESLPGAERNAATRKIVQITDDIKKVLGKSLEDKEGDEKYKDKVQEAQMLHCAFLIGKRRHTICLVEDHSTKPSTFEIDGIKMTFGAEVTAPYRSKGRFTQETLHQFGEDILPSLDDEHQELFDEQAN